MFELASKKNKNFIGSFSYKEIDMNLKEWVDAKGNKIKLNTPAQTTTSSTGNYPSQEDRYKKLLAQIDADNICEYTVNQLTDRILDITVSTAKKSDTPIKIVYKPYVPCYTFIVYGREVNDLTYEEILDLLEMAGIIKNTNLCESGSIAEDFRLYENLWG